MIRGGFLQQRAFLPWICVVEGCCADLAKRKGREMKGRRRSQGRRKAGGEVRERKGNRRKTRQFRESRGNAATDAIVNVRFQSHDCKFAGDVAQQKLSILANFRM
jgi:hypothetical protein